VLKTIISHLFIGIFIFSLHAEIAKTVAVENKHLKLYANFDKNAEPTVKMPKMGLKVAKGVVLVDGKFGKALKLSQNMKVLPDVIYSLNDAIAGEEWTLGMWVKLDQSGSSRTKHTRCFFRTYTSGAWTSGTIWAGINRWTGLFFTRFGADKKGHNCETSSKVLPAQKWTHIAFSMKGKEMSIFVNGYELKSKINREIKQFGDIQRYIRLGVTYPKGKCYLEGALDEFKVFDKSLSGEEVRSIMNTRPGALKIKEEKIAAYLPLDGKFGGFSTDGHLSANASQVAFRKTVNGQGALMVRLNYDAISRLSYPDVNYISGSMMTAGFRFKPEKIDVEERGLLGAKSKNNFWLFSRKDKTISFSLSSKGKTSSVSLKVPGLENNMLLKIRGGYDLKKKQLFLQVNDKNVIATIKFPVITAMKANLMVGDIPGFERYKNCQAAGIIDEILIAPNVLNNFAFNKTVQKARKEYLAKKITTGTIVIAPPSKRELKLWDVSKAYNENTSTRKKICLNALWRFQLSDTDKFPGNSTWQYMAVPGRYSGYENGVSDHQFLIRDANFNIVSKSNVWKGRKDYTYRNYWAERTFRVNPDWKDKSLVLTFEEFSKSQTGKIFLNGKQIALLKSGKNYKVTLDPKLLKYNDDNHLLVHLFSQGGRWSWRGIKGDVWLSVVPAKTLNHPYIVTSCRKKTITLSAIVKNNSVKPEKFSLEAVINGENAPAPIKSKTIEIAPGKSVELKMTQNWKNAKLWDYNNPYLYKISFKLKNSAGKVIDELAPVKFGFREFWIDGPDYYLNGTKIHLRNHSSWSRGSLDYKRCKEYVQAMKALGYNSIRGPFNDKDLYMKNILRACDEVGILVFGNIYGLRSAEYTTWNNPATRSALEKKMRAEIYFMRNHASVIMYYMSVNFLGYGWDYHPKKMADGYLPSFKKDQYEACLEGVKLMRKYDASRPYFLQAGGAFGPVINSNAYFCWWPEAEKIAWAQEWSKNPTKPLHIIETSFPYWNTWMGMDLNNPGAKPLFLVENFARYYGENAYKDFERKWLPKFDDIHGKSANSMKWGLLSYYRKLKLMYRMKARLLEKTILNWRGAGMSGICPFAELGYAFERKSSHSSIHGAYTERRKVTNFTVPGWHPDIVKIPAHRDIDLDRPIPIIYNTLKKILSPVLVYIAGDLKNPTSQAHAWFADTKVNKTAILINDTLKPKMFDLKWRFTCGDFNKTGSIKMLLQPADIKRIPIIVKAPKVTRKTSFKLKISSMNNLKLNVDSFVGSIYPAIIKVPVQSKIALWDKKGFTAKALKTLGVDYLDFSEVKTAGKIKLLIIGRESLTESFALHFQKLELAEKINSGKLNLIVMEQKPATLKMLGLETQAIYARYAFKAAPASPLLKGLTDKALSWWRGTSSLAPAKQAPDTSTQEIVANPLWHWTNLNMVCSYPIFRPTQLGMTPILATGMDLMYTTLLEIKSGKGKILFCQMEVSDRVGISPAATILFSNMLEYYSQNNNTNETHAVYSANSKIIEFLTKLGAKTAQKTDSVIIDTDNDPARLEQLLTKCKAGQDVIIQSKGKNLNTLGLSAKTQKINEYTLTTKGKEFLGNLTARDRFIRYPQKITVFAGKDFTALTKPAFAVVKKLGKGRLFVISLNCISINKKMVRDDREAKKSSRYLADYLVKERIVVFWKTFLNRLNVKSIRFADRFNNLMLKTEQDIAGTWDFRFDPQNQGMKYGWNKKSFNDRNWTTINVPGFWENQKIKSKYKSNTYNGIAWYRKTIKLKKELTGKTLMLQIGAVDDLDHTYVNGVLVGKTGKDTNGYWSAPRNYRIPAKLTAEGQLLIAIRVNDLRGNGGVKNMIQLVSVVNKKNTLISLYLDKIPDYHTETNIRW
jgi:Concanavalin A-like lectin/glucanases superfamily/Glycosyl hydrolases family 2, sugar binding domain/Glycosyl hydrolases family 2